MDAAHAPVILAISSTYFAAIGRWISARTLGESDKLMSNGIRSKDGMLAFICGGSCLFSLPWGKNKGFGAS